MPIVIKGDWKAPEQAVTQASFRVGDKCPNCPTGTMLRGTKREDAVQVYCDKCGFTASRCEPEKADGQKSVT